MNKSVIALLLLGSAAAYANEAADDQANRIAFVGERTRAELQAEVANARVAGTLSVSEFARNAQQAAPGERSRSTVRAEAEQAARTRVIDQLI